MSNNRETRVCEVRGCHRVALPDISLCWKHYRNYLVDFAVESTKEGTHKLVITPCDENPHLAIGTIVPINAHAKGEAD